VAVNWVMPYDLDETASYLNREPDKPGTTTLGSKPPVVQSRCAGPSTMAPFVST